MHGFMNTAGPTEDFRERRKPDRSLAGWMQTRVHDLLYWFVFKPSLFDAFYRNRMRCKVVNSRSKKLKKTFVFS